MYNITLICTKHKECGHCNSIQLYEIIKSIGPEIIFEELSYSNFDKSYRDGNLITLETNAIKKYLHSHDIKHIPVDTYNLPISYDEKLDFMYNRIITNNMIGECRSWRNLIDELSLLESQHGFSFLNSNHNDELFEKINILERTILDIMNDANLFGISKLRRDVMERREQEIINNIYNYSKEHTYNQALLFIGSGHRKSIIERIKNYEMPEETKLNWILYNN